MPEKAVVARPRLPPRPATGGGIPPYADPLMLLLLRSRRLLYVPRAAPLSRAGSACWRALSSSPTPTPVQAGAATPRPSFLSDDRIRVDAPSENYRRLQLVPACTAGVAIGTYLAVPAVLGPTICTTQGVVAAAPTDFVMSQLIPIATAMPLVAGLTAAALADKNYGHRRMAFLCSVAYPGTVYGLSAAALWANSLPAFAASYALLGGLGFYCAYPQVPPFLTSTWFQDSPSTAMSFYMTGFGLGALFSTSVLTQLLGQFRAPPVRVGGLDEVKITLGEHGERVALVDGTPCEVIVATSKDLMASGFASTLEEGVFVLGTGSSGACESMVGLGAAVFVLLQLAAWGYRLPNTKSGRYESKEQAPADDTDGLTVAEATRTPNFPLLFIGSVGVCMTGLPFIQLGKFMANDLFGTALSAQAATIAMGVPFMTSMTNMGARGAWGPVADKFGTDKSMMLFGASVPALMLFPYATGLVNSDVDTALLLFRASAVGSVAVFAGAPVLLPSAAANVFGEKHSGDIYQRLWLSVPLANFLGSSILTQGHAAAYSRSAAELAAEIDENAFSAAFGAPKAELSTLLVRVAQSLP